MNKKLIIAFIVFAAIGGVLFYLLAGESIGVEYNTVVVQNGQVGKYVQDVGVVSSSNIRTYYGNGLSKIEEMSLEVGDPVKKGQLLFKFEDNLDLEIQKAEKQLEALQASYNEVLTGTDAESVNSARIEVSRINKQLKTAQSDKERTETLYNSGAVSRSELEVAENKVDQIRSSLGVAQNSYNKLTKGVSDNIRAKYEADMDVLMLNLEILKKNKSNSIIYADINGIVTEVNTFSGDKPSMGTLLLEIQDPSEKVILVDFMVEDALLIEEGLMAEIVDLDLDIHVNDLKVDKVYPKAFVTLSELSVEENRQTVEIGLTKDAGKLPYGLELETRVMIEAPRQALLIPKGTVIEKDTKQYVEVLVDGNVEEREVQTGIEVNGNYEVKDGLQEGEEVIVNYEED